MDDKKWIVVFVTYCLTLMLACAGIVAYVDPAFHYHAPRTDMFYYYLFDERMLNDGMVRNMDYDTIITGTSLMEVARPSVVDTIFDVHSIKVTAASGSYYEISRNIRNGLKTHSKVRYVFRALDLPEHLVITPDDELSDYVKDTYPEYLYNEKLIDDYKYLFNGDILFDRCMLLIRNNLKGVLGGIESFDHYYYDWVYDGIKTMGENNSKRQIVYHTDKFASHLTEQERIIIKNNVRLNIIALAEEYPNVQFYYFFPPDCITGWGYRYQEGIIGKQVEIEETIAEELVLYSNIHLYDFTMIDEIYDLNHYCDDHHFDDDICNSLFVAMKENAGSLTKENYKEALDAQYLYFNEIDYEHLFMLIK